MFRREGTVEGKKKGGSNHIHFTAIRKKRRRYSVLMHPISKITADRKEGDREEVGYNGTTANFSFF